MEQKYVRDCSEMLVFLGKDMDTRMRNGHQKALFDIAAACMCADLMATSLEIGTCWIGNFIPERVAEAMPSDVQYGVPVIILLLGYPNAD